MEIIKLNNYGNINQIYQLVATEIKKGKFTRFIFEGDNCILSIVTCSQLYSCKLKTIEVELFDKNEEWFNICNDDSIIHYLPVIGLPLLLKAFLYAEEEDIPEIFQSFKTIAELG